MMGGPCRVSNLGKLMVSPPVSNVGLPQVSIRWSLVIMVGRGSESFLEECFFLNTYMYTFRHGLEGYTQR